MHPLLISLLRLIYPLNLPTKTRDRPLQVLALGISRSATESLRQALLHLGYINCYHGFDYVNAPNHSIQWIRLGWAQENSAPLTISREEFDRVLGDCSAVTDFPCGGFAEELLELYPSAQVILNYRDDVDAWAHSVANTLEVVVSGQQWEEWFLTFFQSNLFWRQRSLYWVWSRFFEGDFEKEGKEWYRRHYGTLEERLRGSGRGFLRWKVEDGWKPLCDFLEKPIPECDFPRGNGAEEFFTRFAAVEAARRAQARRNMKVVGLIASSLLSAGVAFMILRNKK